jgi:hypothetical protein
MPQPGLEEGPPYYLLKNDPVAKKYAGPTLRTLAPSRGSRGELPNPTCPGHDSIVLIVIDYIKDWSVCFFLSELHDRLKGTPFRTSPIESPSTNDAVRLASLETAAPAVNSPPSSLGCASSSHFAINCKRKPNELKLEGLSVGFLVAVGFLDSRRE